MRFLSHIKDFLLTNLGIRKIKMSKISIVANAIYVRTHSLKENFSIDEKRAFLPCLSF